MPRLITSKVSRLLSTVAVALALAGGSAVAQSEQSPSTKSLQGTWFVRVTLRNCATNASLGSVDSLVTFHRGGTISESTSSPAFSIGQRGPGHGNWALAEGRRFSQRMVALINFDTSPNLPGTPGFDPSLPVSPGFYAGWSIVTHSVELVDEDHAISSGTNEFFKADGTSYRSGCSTAVAMRFE
jgi:hypothetical protein